MGSPAIFNGKFTKLLTNKGILNSDGSLNQFDGVKNYITYAQFEQGATTGWGLFNTTLTSGLPTGSITAGASSLTLGTTTTNPLDGSYSLQVVAGSSWTAGHGFISDAFTVDRADLGKVLSFRFSYEAASGGSNANWSGILGSQSIGVYIYDVTASAWVQPAGFLGMNQNSGAGVITGTFQTSVTSGQQYRIAVICLQAVASPITINFDQFQISANQVVLGTPVTDWVNYTPSLKGSVSDPNIGTTGTSVGKWRRVGDSLQLFCRVDAGGTGIAAGSGTYYFTIPSGLSIDTAKTPAFPNASSPVGVGNLINQGSAGYNSVASVYSSTGVGVCYNGVDYASTTLPASNWFNAAGDSMEIYCQIPIVGWSSNVQTSSDTDTRVVAASYTFPSTSVSGNVDIANIWTQKFDTHSSFSNANGRYLAPVSGIYRVSFIASKATSGNSITLFKNGVSYTGLFSFAIAGGIASGSASVSLNAGDYITFQPNGTITIDGAFSVERISGPSVITATDSITMSARNSSGQSFTSGSSANVTGWTKDYDSTNSFNASTGIFTVPVSGKYTVKAGFAISQATAAVNAQYSAQLRKNNADYVVLGAKNTETTQSVAVSFGGSASLSLIAGDTINIQIFQASGGTRSLINQAVWNYLSIERIGN